MSEEEIYKKARERVEEKKGFFTHLIVYVLVNILLVIIWWLTGADYPWFLFPLGGWGIGLIFHFLGVFVFSKQTGWERREVEKEADKLRKSGE
jgi:Na+(H+)/acetate symporter ActP